MDKLLGRESHRNEISMLTAAGCWPRQGITLDLLVTWS